MYNRSSAIDIRDGLAGSLMGRTLGYLVLLLLILSASVVVSPLAGRPGMWIGIAAALIGSIMVGRNVGSASRAFIWGAVVAIGMGMLVGPVVWSVAFTETGLLWTTLGTLLIAVLFSAFLVSFVPWDFSRLMPLLFLGLILLIVTGVLSWIIPGVSGLVTSKAYNLIGALIFIGYLLVDFSLMRVRGRVMPAQGAAVVLAVSLLIDIVNLFLFLLRLGRR